jgi:predicted nucleotidyltransferase
MGATSGNSFVSRKEEVQVMASTVQRLTERGLVSPPPWLPSNVHYETLMGSVAYGVAGDASDSDIYGFCISQKDMIFPHLRGEILGFGRQKKRFDQWQQHHVDDPEARKQYDFSIYNIVKYFQLAMENNPNMVDSLFTPEFCIQHITRVGTMVREQRRLFLHKGSWHKFKGYAYSQLHKANIKNPEPGSKRAAIVEKFGWDVKFGYHVVRLIDEAEQILSEQDLDLQRNREQLKAVRAGEMSFEEVQQWFSIKEKALEELYSSSSLRYKPDEQAIKQLLLHCLEEHYGSLEGCIVNPDEAVQALRDVQAILDKHRALL